MVFNFINWSSNFLSSFLYTIMSYSVDSVKEPTEKFLKFHKQEIFSFEMFNYFTEKELEYIYDKSLENIYFLNDLKRENQDLFYKIINDRKQKFENKYNDYILELRETKDITYALNNENHSAKIIKDSQIMNLSFIEEGRKPERENEIAITQIYGNKNNLSINDYITIKDKEYKIVGFVLFPDYTLLMFGDVFASDNSRQTVLLLSNKEYENVLGRETFYFAGVSKTEYDEKKFKDNVVNTFRDYNELSFISSIVSTSNQLRSGAIYDELEGSKAMTLMISVVIVSISIVIVSILIHKIVKEQRGQIGVLKALGYTKKEIGIPYIVAIFIIVLPFLLIGYYLGYTYSDIMKNLYLEVYLLPSVSLGHQFNILFVSIFVPLTIFVFLSYFITIKTLSRRPLELLRPEESKKISKLVMFSQKILKNRKAQTRFKYTFIIKNITKFYVFMFTIIFCGILILMSFSMNNVLDKIAFDYYDRVEYEYKGFVDIGKIDEITNALSDDDEKFLIISDGIYQNDKITLFGIERDSKLHKLYNSRGRNITNKLNEGVIVSKSFIMKYGNKIGDVISVDILGNMHDLKIVEITEEYLEFKIYIYRSYLSVKSTDSDDVSLYNGVFSKVSLDEKLYTYIMNKYDVVDRVENINEFIKCSVLIMTLSAVIIGSIVMLVLTVLIVTDNYYNISLLKVMGYNKKEVNRMILNSYLIYTIIGYLLSIPLVYLILKGIVYYLLHEFNMVFPMSLETVHIIYGFVVTILIFYIGIIMAKRNINKISLQEVLKAYRE